MHLKINFIHSFVCMFFIYFVSARRRVAAKRKKLKNLGKSKSTDTEDEDGDDDCGEDGNLIVRFYFNFMFWF